MGSFLAPRARGGLALARPRAQRAKRPRRPTPQVAPRTGPSVFAARGGATDTRSRRDRGVPRAPRSNHRLAQGADLFPHPPKTPTVPLPPQEQGTGKRGQGTPTTTRQASLFPVSCVPPGRVGDGGAVGGWGNQTRPCERRPLRQRPRVTGRAARGRETLAAHPGAEQRGSRPRRAPSGRGRWRRRAGLAGARRRAAAAARRGKERAAERKQASRPTARLCAGKSRGPGSPRGLGSGDVKEATSSC